MDGWMDWFIRYSLVNDKCYVSNKLRYMEHQFFFYFALFVPWQQTAENTFVFPLSNEEMPRKRSLDVSLTAEATNSLVQD